MSLTCHPLKCMWIWPSMVTYTICWPNNVIQNDGRDLQKSPGISSVSTLGPRQNSRHFAKTFSNAFSWMKIFEFRLKVHWILFLMVQLTIFQLWFRKWLGAHHATNHHLIQWQSSLLTHIRVTRPQWINGWDALYKLRDIFMVHTLHCNHRRHSVNSSIELRDRGTTRLQPRNMHAWVVTEWPLQTLP